MRALLAVVVAAALGVLLGLAFTVRVLDSGLQTVVAGPWEGAPRGGTPDIDPYALAEVQRSSRLPLGVAEGLTFVARSDDAGHPLSGACDYEVRGPMPMARYWTLSLLDTHGAPVADIAQRYGFTSAEVLRYVGAPVSVVVAPKARAGNWLPTGRSDPFVLMLRLYDTGLSTFGSVFDAGTMPKVVKLGCG